LNFGTSTFVFALICLGFAGAYVFAEWRGLRSARWTAKAAASTAFVFLAIVSGGADSTYGILILAALGLSWFGDLFLLSMRNSFLLAGIAAFLIAHVAYAAAFVARGIDSTVFVIALILWNTAALFVLYWLWKYLEGYFRIAVPVYLAAITLMTALAVATSSPLLITAGIAFAVSDISVARNRFVGRSINNKLWGVPLYYFGQVLFAISVIPGTQ
jgi:uncharacterized membrane protein YhhN